MFERLGAEESTALQKLARRVRDELAAAGLPVVAPELDPVLAGGAEVDIDDGDDAAGGVFVGWQSSPRLRACTSRAFRLKQLDEVPGYRPGLHYAGWLRAVVLAPMVQNRQQTARNEPADRRRDAESTIAEAEREGWGGEARS